VMKKKMEKNQMMMSKFYLNKNNRFIYSLFVF